MFCLHRGSVLVICVPWSAAPLSLRPRHWWLRSSLLECGGVGLSTRPLLLLSAHPSPKSLHARPQSSLGPPGFHTLPSLSFSPYNEFASPSGFLLRPSCAQLGPSCSQRGLCDHITHSPDTWCVHPTTPQTRRALPSCCVNSPRVQVSFY